MYQHTVCIGPGGRGVALYLPSFMFYCTPPYVVPGNRCTLASLQFVAASTINLTFGLLAFSYA